MWNLEKWYRWTYLQNQNRDTDVGNGHVDTGGAGRGGRDKQIRIDVYTLPCVKHMASGDSQYSTRSSALCSVMAYIGRIVGRSKMEGIYM